MEMNFHRGSMQRNHIWLALVQRMMDAAWVGILVPLLCLDYGVDFTRNYQWLAWLGVLLTWVMMGGVDAYRPWRGTSLWAEFKVLLLGWLLVVSSFLFLAWAMKVGESFSRLVLASWFVSVPLVLMLMHGAQRGMLRFLRLRGYNTRRVIVVGAGDLGEQLVKRIQKSEWMGVKVVAFFDDDARKHGTLVAGVDILGATDEVLAFVKKEDVDKVYFALPMRAEKRMRKVFDDLQDTTTSLYLIPDLFIFELMGARDENIAGMPAFALCETPMTGPFGSLKRAEDVILSSVILCFIAPVMLGIAIAIKLTSKGPVIFKQYRYGLNSQRIKVYKFRSMTVCENDDTIIRQAGKNDVRVTPLGAFLRKTSLDELPQFVNVLQGRMSVVGPRPHAVAHNEQYRKLIKGYMWRHKMKPGITGWAQVNGWRGETDTLEKMEKRVEYDIDYIRRWSIGLDLKIVFLTVFKGFINKNAY